MISSIPRYGVESSYCEQNCFPGLLLSVCHWYLGKLVIFVLCILYLACCCLWACEFCLYYILCIPGLSRTPKGIPDFPNALFSIWDDHVISVLEPTYVMEYICWLLCVKSFPHLWDEDDLSFWKCSKIQFTHILLRIFLSVFMKELVPEFSSIRLSI